MKRAVVVKMDKIEKKKSKRKVDKSTKNAIYQLIYDYLQRDDSTHDVAELLQRKVKLVANFAFVCNVYWGVG